VITLIALGQDWRSAPPADLWREQRCWFHKIANALAALQKSAHPGAKNAVAKITDDVAGCNGK
jgi:hypothetical protein